MSKPIARPPKPARALLSNCASLCQGVDNGPVAQSDKTSDDAATMRRSGDGPNKASVNAAVSV